MSDKRAPKPEDSFLDLLFGLNNLKSPVAQQEEIHTSDEPQAEESEPEGILSEEDKRAYGYPSNWFK